MKWFRSWHGAPTDTKWLMIAARAKVQPVVVIATAWALMDCASQAEERGDVSHFCHESFAAFAGVTSDEVQNVMDVLRSTGIITDNHLKAWAKRQPKREDNSTERTKEYRERKRNQTQRDASVTQCDAPEKSRVDTDIKKEPSVQKKDNTEFETWWFVYPHKVGKGAARKAWSTACGLASLETLLQGVEKYARDKPADRPWCNPATWLNQQRWMDEPGPEPNSGKRGWGETAMEMIRDEETRNSQIGVTTDVLTALPPTKRG